MDLRDVHPPREARRIEALAGVLRETFPAMSAAQARLQAETIAAARDEAPYLHREDKDRDELRRLSAALRDVRGAIEGLSPYAATALSEALFSIRNHIPDRDIPSGLAEALRLAGEAARRAEERIGDGKPRGPTNWQALAVVGAARECWAAAGMTPPDNLNATGGPFGRFLEAVFAALEIGVGARVAFNAWRREVHSRA